MKKRTLVQTALAALVTLSMGVAFAQTTPIKFQLDWRFEGPSALFLTPLAKGYFKDANLGVTIDAGSGSGGAVVLWCGSHLAPPMTWALPIWQR
jgi:NitT/TauT family transport system substrate-binding protein